MIYLGTVARNDDPAERGRVRAKVPGVFEPSTDWLIPASPFGGRARRGGCVTPAQDSAVLVIYAEGNLSKGYYIAVGEDAYSSDGETIIQLGDLAVSLVEDGGVKVTDGASKIELQKTAGHLLIKAPATVRIEATTVKIEAPDLVLNGRRVVPGSDPI